MISGTTNIRSMPRSLAYRISSLKEKGEKNMFQQIIDIWTKYSDVFISGLIGTLGLATLTVLMATVLGDTNSFSAGASFRTAKNQYGNQNLGISPIIKAKLNGFTFGATYNFGLSDIQQYAGNSFMLSVGYNIENFINTRGYRY